MTNPFSLATKNWLDMISVSPSSTLSGLDPAPELMEGIVSGDIRNRKALILGSELSDMSRTAGWGQWKNYRNLSNAILDMRKERLSIT